jgi:hypothetical protein
MRSKTFLALLLDHGKNLFPGISPTGIPSVAISAWNAVCMMGSGHAAAMVYWLTGSSRQPW